MLDVPRHEPGHPRARRALRLHLEPQLRGSSGPRRKDPPGLSADGRGGGDRGALHRHQGLAMSEASPGATWQQEKLVGAFLAERKTLMPLLEIQEDIVRRLLTRNLHAVGRFLDLGSGDGAMSELALSLYPDAEAVLVDFSEPMLEA